MVAQKKRKQLATFAQKICVTYFTSSTYVGIFNDSLPTNFQPSPIVERLKICLHLAKLWQEQQIFDSRVASCRYYCVILYNLAAAVVGQIY